jgi:undecaprenyl-diphosphatase
MGWPFFWGFVSAAVSGFLVIAFLLSYLRRHDFGIFMWYRIAVAALAIVLVLTGARPATV